MTAKGGTEGSRIPVTLLYSAPVEHYVCAVCGYVESYVIHVGALRKIEESWPRVGDVQGIRLPAGQGARFIRPYKRRKRLGPLMADLFEAD
jgi:hypothetical protein